MFSDVKFHLIYQDRQLPGPQLPVPAYLRPGRFPGWVLSGTAAQSAAAMTAILRSSGHQAVGTGYSRARLALFPSDLDKANITPAQRDFWRSVFNTLGDGEFAACVFDRFRPLDRTTLQDRRRKSRPQGLARDFPHARSRNLFAGAAYRQSQPNWSRCCSIYRADDSSSELGTALYLPKDRSFISEGGPHLEFEDFDHVMSVPYAPNVMASFPKTKACFHGVEPVKGREQTARRAVLRSQRPGQGIAATPRRSAR